MVVFFWGYEARLTRGASFLGRIKCNGLSGRGIYYGFVQFGRNNPPVSRLSRFIGELDTETGVALDDIHDMKQMLYDLHQVGGGLVRDIVTHSFGEELKGHSRCG